MPSASIIIPAFNQAGLTARCLDALGRPEGFEIIVVDDGSTDDTAAVLGRFSGSARVLSHAENLGFAKSCNDGAALAASEHLVFLNNDTVPSRDWLAALLEYATTHPEAAAVGARLLFPDGTVQHAGVVIGQDGYPRHIYRGFPGDHPAVLKSRRFQIVTAACILVRREVFNQMHGFDTSFRNGFEDVDLCLRIGQGGRQVHYCAGSVVTHLESVAAGRFRDEGNNVRLYRERWMARVNRDDLQYYLADGLLEVHYEGHYPIGIEASALLATLGGAGRDVERERLLLERSRQVSELLRENTRLAIELGNRREDSPELNYRRLRDEVREAVGKAVPRGSTVLVISRGDGSLLQLTGCQGWHFPQTDRGAYAGHHPASSAEAITHLETLRRKGAEFLVIPSSSAWWMEHYGAFADHLESRYSRFEGSAQSCRIYKLTHRIHA